MPVVKYTVLRLLLIAAAGCLLYLLGMRGALLYIGAVVVGALVSYLVLSGPRLRAAAVLRAAAQSHPRAASRDSDAIAEDAQVSTETEKHS